MVFDHIGIMNEDDEGADRFYHTILGLEKIRESSLSAELGRQLFLIDREVKMLVYGKESLVVEIFIVPDSRRESPSISHFCLKVPDPAALLEKAEKEGAKVISAERGERTVFFLEDYSGNRIELKPQLQPEGIYG